MKIIKLYLILFVIIACNNNNSKDSFYQNSKELKKGMGINQTIDKMKGQPYVIYDIENKLTDKKIRLFLRYWDKNSNTDIFLYFDDSLKLYEINYDD